MIILTALALIIGAILAVVLFAGLPIWTGRAITAIWSAMEKRK